MESYLDCIPSEYENDCEIPKFRISIPPIRKESYCNSINENEKIVVLGTSNSFDNKNNEIKNSSKENIQDKENSQTGNNQQLSTNPLNPINIEENSSDEDSKSNYRSQSLIIQKDDPQVPKVYIIDILNHVIKNEVKNICTINYFQGPNRSQTEINEKMRAILIDWLIDAHHNLKMLNSSLFMAINIVDRYLARHALKKDDLQLIGITSLFIAGKYEEIYPPNIKVYIKCLDKPYTESNIISVEGYLLTDLNLDLVYNSSLFFFELFAKHFNLGEKESYNLGLLILHICL